MVISRSLFSIFNYFAVRSAYRRTSLHTHPDHVDQANIALVQAANRRFVCVTGVYQLLSEEHWRFEHHIIVQVQVAQEQLAQQQVAQVQLAQQQLEQDLFAQQQAELAHAQATLGQEQQLFAQQQAELAHAQATLGQEQQLFADQAQQFAREKHEHAEQVVQMAEHQQLVHQAQSENEANLAQEQAQLLLGDAQLDHVQPLARMAQLSQELEAFNKRIAEALHERYRYNAQEKVEAQVMYEASMLEKEQEAMEEQMALDAMEDMKEKEEIEEKDALAAMEEEEEEVAMEGDVALAAEQPG
jgi:hypothetical protein